MHKYCDISGRWVGKTQGDFKNPQGWTNYTVCFTKAIQEIIRELYKESAEDAQVVTDAWSVWRRETKISRSKQWVVHWSKGTTTLLVPSVNKLRYNLG